jgi:hypothetical protein
MSSYGTAPHEHVIQTAGMAVNGYMRYSARL